MAINLQTLKSLKDMQEREFHKNNMVLLFSDGTDDAVFDVFDMEEERNFVMYYFMQNGEETTEFLSRDEFVDMIAKLSNCGFKKVAEGKTFAEVKEKAEYKILGNSRK